MVDCFITFFFVFAVSFLLATSSFSSADLAAADLARLVGVALLEGVLEGLVTPPAVEEEDLRLDLLFEIAREDYP